MIAAAITLGLVSSLHCMGMCGLIHFGVFHGKRDWFDFGLYHGGRIYIYMMLALFAGLTKDLLPLHEFQSNVTVIAGVSILIVTVLQFIYHHQLSTFFLKHLKIQSALSTLSSWDMPFKHFFMGMLNGLLPCGVVYIAVFASLGYEDSFGGLAYMLAFGVSTMPIFLAMYTLPKSFLQKITWLKMIKPVYLGLVLGAVMIVRGVQMDTTDFRDESGKMEIPSCHK